MKRKVLITTAIILILLALTFAGCDDTGSGGENPPGPVVVEKDVTVSAINPNVQIHENSIANFNFATLFVIRCDGADILVQDSYLDTSNVPSEPGQSGFVTCTFEGKTARCDIVVKGIEYALQLLVQEVSISQLQLDEGYDFTQFFVATQDGNAVEISSDMTESTVRREPGDYEFSVAYAGEKKTLVVHITEAHNIEIINSYSVCELLEEDVATFDCTELFSLYLDGVMVEITDDMIDASQLQGASVGDTCEVTLSYSYKGDGASKSAYVRIVAPKTLSITAKNVVTYPNGDFIDLTSLFTVVKGDEVMPVTIDMISGNIDYSDEGVNTITLQYEGETAYATVTVKRGVVINMPKGDTIVVTKGTNKNEYPFASDVSVVINGLEFPFANYYIDVTDVDFDTVGVYEATISIPYGYNPVAEVAVVRYVVRENAYTVTIAQDEVVLTKGTTSYNVLSNVSVRINGKGKVLTYDKSVAQADRAAVWAQLLSSPIDFGAIGVQDVSLALYVDGVDEEPVVVDFTVRIQSNVTVSATGKVVFVGDSVYTRDLFEIKDGNQDVKVTSDMLEGKVNTLKSGVYTVKLNYYGLCASANVVVLSDDVVGTYKTNMTTIPPEVDTSQSTDEEDDYGYSDGYEDYDEPTPPTVLKNMTISRENGIVINGNRAKVVGGVDESTLTVSVGTSKFTLHLSDGIAVIDPDNSLKMSFTNDVRPLVYFKSDVWELEDRVTVNRGANYVLSVTYATFSIDTFRIRRVGTDEEKWFALYTRLYSKTSADTVYNVSWGFATYSDGFEPRKYAEATLTYDGIGYDFEMTDGYTGKMKEDTAQKKYTSMTFKGTVDGQDARLTTDQYEAFTLKVAGSTLFSAGTYEINNMKNGGPDYAKDVVFLYAYETEFYSYKFNLDVENKTFEVVQKDGLEGKYECNGAYIFLDGYGTGMAKLTDMKYKQVRLAYTVNGNELSVRFIEPEYDFAFGESAQFFLHPFGNVLATKYMENNAFAGEKFVNSHIQTGALINVDTTVFEKGNFTIVQPKILDSIHIVTKDGELTGTAKQNAVDLTKVKTGAGGFYQYTISLEIGGKQVQAYYALQILGVVYSKNPLATDFGKGIVSGSVGLSIDTYGRLTLDCGDQYVGLVNIADDGSFYARAFGAEGGYVDVKGKSAGNGIVFVRGTGEVTFSDYFTTGKVSVAGGQGGVLRKFVVGGEQTYTFSQSANSIGYTATLSLVSGADISQNGAIVEIVTESGRVLAKIAEWGNKSAGLTFADKYRGSYVFSDDASVDFVVDGFGGFTANGGAVQGTYSVNSNGTLLVKASDGEMQIFAIDVENMTYSVVEFDFGSVLVGKTFSASYIFSCENSDAWGYMADTSFRFASGKEIYATSTSDEHDNGEDRCGADYYSPSFASATGLKGTYSLDGNVLTVSVGGATFTFELDDVVEPTQLKCTSTTLEESEHGSFKIGQIFYVK